MPAGKTRALSRPAGLFARRPHAGQGRCALLEDHLQRNADWRPLVFLVRCCAPNAAFRHPTIAGSLLPHVLGSDVAGEVLAVQPGCKRLKVGDNVYGDIGANTFTVSGTKTKELGGYARFVVALDTQLGVVPEGMSLEVAGSLPKVALTSYKALVWYAGAKNDSLWQKQPTV